MRSIWLAIEERFYGKLSSMRKEKEILQISEKKGKRKHPDPLKEDAQKGFFFEERLSEKTWTKGGIYIHEELFLFQQNFTTDTNVDMGKDEWIQ